MVRMNFIVHRVLPVGFLCAALAGAQTPPLSGIAHVAFRVGDVKAAREFYQKLGFEQAFEFAQGTETREAFLKVNDRQFIELYPRTADAQPLGLMHVCYEAADLAAVNADYIKRGLTPSVVRKAGAGNLLFTLHDPEDAVIEYTQYMPGSRHTEDRGKHLGEHRVSEQLLGAAFPVKDLGAMREFYASRLGFQDMGRGAHILLKVPGGSNHFVELESAASQAKAGLWFGIADARRAAADLEKRGFTVKAAPTSVSVTDPDGVTIWFTVSAGQ